MSTPVVQLEKAFKTLIDNLAIAGLNVYTGLDNEEILASVNNGVIVSAQGYEEFIKDTGIYKVPMQLKLLQTAAEGTPSDFDALAGEVFGALATDKSVISGYSDFWIADLTTLPGDKGQEGRTWTLTYNVDVVGGLK